MFGIGSIIGKIFGTDKAITKSIDVVASGLDKLVYTDEEKAEAAAASRSEARGMFIEWMRNTQGQNLARRVLAFAVAGTWLGSYVVAKVCALIAIFWAARAEDLADCAEILSESSGELGSAAMLILTFYFAAPHIDKVIEPFTKNFAGLKKGADNGK